MRQKANEKQYDKGYSMYYESHNDTDTTNALFTMITALNSKIYDLEIALSEIKIYK